MTETPGGTPLKLDSPLLVHWEYASEERLAVRNKTFPDRESMRRFVAATITRAHLADQVPEINKPFRARTSHVVLVARKAA